MQGVQWWNGEAIWRAVMLPKFAVFDFSWLAHFPLIAAAVSIIVMILETSYALMMWHPVTRKIWLPMIILLHTAIAVLMGLWLFSAIMIWMNLSGFGFSVWKGSQQLPILKTKKVELPSPL
jgi:uncharacterized membrane protein